MSEALSAILLDLDGTLVDSAPELAQAVNEAFKPLGRRELGGNEIRNMIGKGIPVLTQRALAATGNMPDKDATQQIIDRVRSIYDTLPPPRVYDGVGDTLAQWHQWGLTLIICTNKPEISARRLIAALGFNRFIATLAGGDTYPKRKPHPHHLLQPLLDLGLGPGAAIMVGDSQIDARAAHDANIPFIAVSYGYDDETDLTLDAAHTVECFADITDVVIQLAEKRGFAFPPWREV
jgi:phosphoglycolate phosphatase